MAPLAQLLAVASLLCPLTSAADCSGDGSCPNLHDATSLIQLNKAEAVKRGQLSGPEGAAEKVASPKTASADNGADAELADSSEEVTNDDQDRYIEGGVFSRAGANRTGANRTRNPEICINSEYIRQSSGTYFYKANAGKASLGSYGNMEDCWTCSGTMTFKGPDLATKTQWLQPVPQVVQHVENITLTSGQISSFSASVLAKVTAPAGTASGHAGASGSGDSSKAFKAVVLTFHSVDHIVSKINGDPKALAAMKRFSSPRIVTEIMKLESQQDSTDNSCLEGSAGAAAGDATGAVSGNAEATAKACKQMTVSLSAGTVIAYKLQTPTWNRAKTQIVDLSPADPCSYYNPTCGCNIFR